VVSVAVDVQGPEKVLPYLEKADAKFVTLIDQINLLSGLFGFKAVPNGLLIDESGILNYQKYSGFDVRRREFREIVETWIEGASAEWLLSRMKEDVMGGPDHQKAIRLFQIGVDYYNQGKLKESLEEWGRARDLEPDNWVIRKQIWAVQNPEKFYDGKVDGNWQQHQIEQGT
jgi:hypothetical protein